MPSLYRGLAFGGLHCQPDVHYFDDRCCEDRLRSGAFDLLSLPERFVSSILIMPFVASGSEFIQFDNSTMINVICILDTSIIKHNLI